MSGNWRLFDCILVPNWLRLISRLLGKQLLPTFHFFAINTWTQLHVPQLPLHYMGLSIHPRLTFPTDLKWSYTGTTSSKSLTGESCHWRGPTSWRLGCGLSLSRRKDWTTAVWRESGSFYCLKRCSILTTAYLNTLPRKSLLTCALAWELQTVLRCVNMQWLRFIQPAL